MTFPIPTLSGPNAGPRFYPSAKSARILLALMLSTGLSQALLADESTPRGFAWPETPSLNFYGNPGVIDMPSAEMMPDAQFATSVSSFGGITRMNLQVQALPWVSVAFRYTETQDRNLFNFGDFYDRNFDLRFRLWQEGRRCHDQAGGGGGR